jgi:hypothetical protein
VLLEIKKNKYKNIESSENNSQLKTKNDVSNENDNSNKNNGFDHISVLSTLHIWLIKTIKFSLKKEEIKNSAFLNEIDIDNVIIGKYIYKYI